LEQAFPSWARPPKARAAGLEGSCDAAFHAGAGLALFDTILREKPPFAGALRQRLALRAAAACAALARHREDLSALRDAEHLASVGRETSPAGRVHRLWRLFASRSTRLDAPTLRTAADLLALSDGANFEEFAESLREIVAGAENPLAAAAGASAGAMKLFRDAPAPIGADVSSAGDKPDVEIFALWLADLALARRLGWDAPVPLLATAIAHPSLRRGAAGKRPRPGDPGWADATAGAYAMATQEAYVLAGELSRRTEKLLAVQPKLRAKGAGRVVELLLDDDAVSPARAAKLARLSDRAARRLFDRLVALGAARELSGRPNFRLYGL
jgi:predicted ArsR family transcriptional regulator